MEKIEIQSYPCLCLSTAFGPFVPWCQLMSINNHSQNTHTHRIQTKRKKKKKKLIIQKRSNYGCIMLTTIWVWVQLWIAQTISKDLVFEFFDQNLVMWSWICLINQNWSSWWFYTLKFLHVWLLYILTRQILTILKILTGMIAMYLKILKCMIAIYLNEANS